MTERVVQWQSPNPVAVRAVVLGVFALGLAAGVAFVLLRRPNAPPPAEIAGDPLLVEGRGLFLSRCVSCHGMSGRGDGPIAKGLQGPPVRDLTATTWKHGEKPEQVRAVIDRGIPNSAMPGWGSTFGPEGVRAVTAYVYHLGGRAVPAELRTP
jgi:cytochrome c oxidase cbb3-type subunit III